MGPTECHLQTILDELSTLQVADLLAGYRQMLDGLPAGDPVRPDVEVLHSALAQELARRIRAAVESD